MSSLRFACQWPCRPESMLLRMAIVFFLTASTRAASNSDQKVLVCVGCTRGIGASVARQMAARNYHVILAGRSEHVGKAVAEMIGGTYVPTDMRNLSQLRELFALAETKFGGMDAVFCSGGGEPFVPPLDSTLEQTERLLEITVDASVIVHELAIKALAKRGGGSLVLTSSAAAYSTNHDDPSLAYYAASKLFVAGLAQQSRGLSASHNIGVYAVAPAVFQAPSTITKATYDLACRTNPVVPCCPGDPADAAAVVVAMLDQMTEYSPGAVVVVDHGYSLEAQSFDNNNNNHNTMEVLSRLRNAEGRALGEDAAFIQAQSAQQTQQCKAQMDRAQEL